MNKISSLLIGLLAAVFLLSGCQLFSGDETPAAGQQPQETAIATADDSDLVTPTPKPARPTATPTATPTQPATPVVQRILFAPGATSATREGAFSAGQQHNYVFSALGGQTARVELASDGDTANFSIAAMDASPAYKTLDDPARNWQGTLPGTQEYMIMITAPEATTYSLILTIEPLDDSSLPVVSNPGSPPADRCIVTHPGSTSVVTAYLGPSTAFAPVAHLGNWAVILNGENGWYQIQIGPGQTGWVRETEVGFAGPCDHVDEPIRFELPATGSAYRDSRSILPGQAHRYVFVAQAGQRLLIDLNSSGQVNFALVGVDSGQPLKRIVNEDRTWEGILPRNQEYIVTVVPGDQAANYELLVAAQPAPPFPVVYDAHTATLLGGHKDALWVDAQAAASALLGGELYDFFQVDQRLGQAAGSAPLATGGICPGYTLQLTTPPADPLTLAVAGADWQVNLRPAAPIELSPAQRQALADLLAGQGLTTSAAELAVQEALAADIDGNGVDEIIVRASRLQDGGSTPAVAAGDYVVVAVLMEISDQLHAEPLILDAYPQANDLAYPWRYTVSGVLDLNGDGQLEVVLAGDRWEGVSTTVYGVGTAGGSTVVLQSSCAE